VEYFNGHFSQCLPISQGRDPLALRRDGRIVARYGDVELQSVFQPVCLSGVTHPLLGQAALLRVRAADGNSPPPKQVFARADSPEAVVYLDRLCRITHMLNYLQDLPDEGLLFLHVHPRHVLSVRGDHGWFFEHVLHRCGLDPQRIVLEVRVDTVPKDERLRYLQALRSYRARGYGLSAAINELTLADNSLDFLWRLQPDIVKADRSLLIGAERSLVKRHELTTMVSLFKHAGIEILQDGIETQQQLRLAQSLGASLLKGYYLGAPSAVPHAPKAHEPPRLRLLPFLATA
jgi:EAL domain-containing protein (putative c-di-GMP-specific phosphodiesterase class I)